MDMEKVSDILMAVSISSDTCKARILKLAIQAMKELLKMGIKGEPLWKRIGDGREVLDVLEYMRVFGQIDPTLENIIKSIEVGVDNDKQGLETSWNSRLKESGLDPLNIEASREVCCVHMTPINLVQLFMNLNHWVTAFSNIVTGVKLIGVLSTTLDGMLLVISAEFHIPTALLPARSCYFARYCKQLGNGIWGVVDVSLETLFPYPQVNFRKRPSGCLIQQMQNGYSKVTWVEHTEVDNKSVHSIFKRLVSSGFAFSARRWVASLTRHCQELQALMHPTQNGNLIKEGGRKSLLKLSERMMKSYCQDINASSKNQWSPLLITGAEDIKVMTRSVRLVSAKPPVNTVIFTTTIQLQASPMKVFDFLQNANTRAQWDLLSHGHFIQEIACIGNGENPANRVSILQANSAPNKIEILYLQKSYKDETCSYVIYAPIDTMSMSKVLVGGDPDSLSILPSGFAILPYAAPNREATTLLTIAFHIINRELVNLESIETIYGIITQTSSLIKDALENND